MDDIIYYKPIQKLFEIIKKFQAFIDPDILTTIQENLDAKKIRIKENLGNEDQPQQNLSKLSH